MGLLSYHAGLRYLALDSEEVRTMIGLLLALPSRGISTLDLSNVSRPAVCDSWLKMVTRGPDGHTESYRPQRPKPVGGSCGSKPVPIVNLKA